MGNFPARTALFIKPGLRDWSENRNFSKLQAFGFRRTFEKMGIFPARKAVFIKAGLRVWSKNHDFSKLQAFGFRRTFEKWGFSWRENRFSLSLG